MGSTERISIHSVCNNTTNPIEHYKFLNEQKNK